MYLRYVRYVLYVMYVDFRHRLVRYETGGPTDSQRRRWGKKFWWFDRHVGVGEASGPTPKAWLTPHRRTWTDEATASTEWKILKLTAGTWTQWTLSLNWVESWYQLRPLTTWCVELSQKNRGSRAVRTLSTYGVQDKHFFLSGAWLQKVQGKMSPLITPFGFLPSIPTWRLVQISLCGKNKQPC
jgi:hypothetical protein